MSSREQLPLIRNVTRNVLAWFKKIRRTNPLVSDSRGSYNSQLSLLLAEEILLSFKTLDDKGTFDAPVLSWRDSGQRGRTVRGIERGLT